MFGLSDEHEISVHAKISWSILLQSIPIFLILTFIVPSPWGKTINNYWSLGPRIPARVAWCFFESPNLLWCYWCWTQNDTLSLPVSQLFLLALFFLHYIQRTIVYPLLMSSNTTPMPLVVVLFAFCFTSVNGYLQAQGLCRFTSLPERWHFHPQFIFGIILFICGAILNVYSDATLRRLRALSPNRRHIPSGGFFELVSAPHYFGEIVEWTGFCIACDASLASVAFCVYTMANLIPRAIAHHQWYRNTFPTYPPHRKAVIPFVL